MVASENFPASLAKFYAYRLTAIILIFSLYSSFSEITIKDAENFITTKLNEFPYIFFQSKVQSFPFLVEQRVESMIILQKNDSTRLDKKKKRRMEFDKISSFILEDKIV